MFRGSGVNAAGLARPPATLAAGRAGTSRQVRWHHPDRTGQQADNWGGGWLHEDMSGHNKIGLACQGKSRQPEAVVKHKQKPHRQPRLQPSCAK
jgi:hypothetical protein